MQNMATFLQPGIDESLVFPDGQPHVCVNTMDRNFVCRIASSDDLFRLAMAASVAKPRRLTIAYLMGGRMDRSLSASEPYTLKVMCDLINSLGIEQVTVFCPHSQATSDLLSNYWYSQQRLMEDMFFGYAVDVLSEKDWGEMSIVFPDEGACKRFCKADWFKATSYPVVTMSKDRDERTGKIRGIDIYRGKPTDHCIIVDDLCDGGATFVGAASVLKSNGAKKVSLVVAHGIFSKGTTLDGVDSIVTTNSYKEWQSGQDFTVYKL